MKEKTKPLENFCARCGANVGIREIDLGVFETDGSPDGWRAAAPRCRLHAHLCWSCGDLIAEWIGAWLKELD